jgi:HlyD family secretion protein
VDAFPNRVFQGTVRQVRLNPTTQQNVVTYDVVIAVDNPDQVLMPGMTAYVNILVASRKNALLVPNAALRFRPAEAPKPQPGRADAGGGTVYLLENGRPRPVRVGLGITDSRMTEIVGGELKEGDAVIVEDRQPPAKPAAGPGMRLF